MSGFVAISRSMLDHPLFKGEPQRVYAWVWLISNAAWKPTPFDVNGKIVTIERGQVCASIRHLAEEWGMSKSAAERFITRLKTETMIETAAGHGKLVITLCNYEKYQALEKRKRDSNRDTSGTAAGHERDIKEPYNHLTKEKEGESPPPATPKINEVDALVATWNEICDIANLRRCVSVDDTRRRKAALRIKELGLEEMQECCARAGLSKFLTGHNDRNYRAGIEVILEPSKLTKLREGMYDDDAPRSRPPPEPRQRSGLRTNALIDQVTKGLRA